MGKLTTTGYIPSTIQEIKDDLEAQAVATVTDYETLPSELRENLIQVSVLPIKKFEDGISIFLNSIGLGYANDQLFYNYGQTFGVKPKGAIKGQVTAIFTGRKGTFIPINTKIKSSTANFMTTATGIIGVLGSVSILATTTDNIDVIPANSVNVLVTQINGVTGVNNPANGIAPEPAQTIEEYKAIVYNAVQSPRQGEIQGFFYAINSILTVTQRLVKVLPYDYTDPLGNVRKALNIIVGGGDEYLIADAIFNNFLAYSYIRGNPSDGDTSRIVNVDLSYFDTVYPIQFLRPKLLDMGLVVDLKVYVMELSEAIINEPVTSAFTNFINSLQLGNNLNIPLLEDTLYTSLRLLGVTPANIKQASFTVTFNGVVATPDEFGSFNIKVDEYLTLTSFSLIVG